MRTSTKSLLMALAVGSLAVSALARDTVKVPEGTDIKLEFAQEMSSKTAMAGDRVKLTVDENLVVEGRTVVKAGTTVWGKIENVKKRDRFGVNAQIKLKVMPVKTISGSTLQVRPKVEGERVGEQTGGAAAASVGGAVLLGPVGLIGGYFIVGKHVEVDPGDKLTVTVMKDSWANIK